MTRTLEEITEALEPDTVRQALQQQLTNVKRMIANNVVSLQIEVPTMEPDMQQGVAAGLEREIARLDGVQSDIEERLRSSDGLLKGLQPTRAAKRRVAKRELKNGLRGDPVEEPA